jgi:hypothetical protein
MNRIIFTGDPFRVSAMLPGQFSNVRWLHKVLANKIAELTNAEILIVYPLSERYLEVLSGYGLPSEPEGWASLFWMEPPDWLVEEFRREFGKTLIVGIELPPIMTRALDLAGVRWVEVNVSPIRFFPDWVLHIKTSPLLQLDELARYAIGMPEVHNAVKHVSNWYESSRLNIRREVFFAQTNQDRTLIDENGFAGVERLRREGIRPEGLFVKPHPWEPKGEVVSWLVSEGALVTHEPTYALLSDAAVNVVTLSSSVGREALCFRRPSTILHPRVQDWSNKGLDFHVYSKSRELWRNLLDLAGFTTVLGQSEFLDFTPNQLRAGIGGQGLDLAVWQDLDPDRWMKDAKIL